MRAFLLLTLGRYQKAVRVEPWGSLGNRYDTPRRDQSAQSGAYPLYSGFAAAAVLNLGHAARFAEPPDKTRGKIVSGAEGDAINVLAGGHRLSVRLPVRLLGIETPESSTLRCGYAECEGRRPARDAAVGR